MISTNYIDPFLKQFLIAVGILIACIIIATNTHAQKLTIGILAEKNCYGMQAGSSMAVTFPKLFTVGAFFQQEVKQATESDNRTIQLAGVLIDFPLIADERLALIGRVKPSIANEKFIVVIPAIETQVKIFDFLQLTGEVSYRAGNPAVALKTNLIISTNK